MRTNVAIRSVCSRAGTTVPGTGHWTLPELWKKYWRALKKHCGPQCKKVSFGICAPQKLPEVRTSCPPFFGSPTPPPGGPGKPRGDAQRLHHTLVMNCVPEPDENKFTPHPLEDMCRVRRGLSRREAALDALRHRLHRRGCYCANEELPQYVTNGPLCQKHSGPFPCRGGMAAVISLPLALSPQAGMVAVLLRRAAPVALEHLGEIALGRIVQKEGDV